MGRRASRRHASFSELTENFERLNVATETEDADAARRAASARRPSLSNAIVNPFAAEGEPAKASSPKADSDVSMEDVSVKVLNAPSLPSAPVYRGSTYEDRRVFMKQYERYTTALTAFQNPANQPFCMPVSACIEGDTRQRIALFEFGCSPHEITEEQWVNYFLQAKVSTFRNYVAIDAEMKTLKMDVSLREAPSRMSRLTRDLYVKLEAHNLLQEMFTEAPRRIVGYLLEALEPEGFREIVRHQLTLETHKAKKKQIVPFCKWVSGMLEQYMQWNDIARQQKLTLNLKTDEKAKKSAKPPKPAGAGSTGAASAGAAVAPRLETKRPALPCLKCNSPEHSVRHCPRAQPGEAAALVAEARARRQQRQATNLSTKRVQSAAGNVPTPSSASGIERGTVPANIDGLDVNATLLDSGSDESLVARAVVKALEDRGVEIEVCKPAMPARLIPVGKQAVMAPRCVRFKRISFVTSAGPLILRNHCCWVDETDDDLSLNIGRPTMEQLGYSVDGLLVAALAKQSEYISDTKLPDTPESPLLRMQRLQHVACYESIAEPPTTPLDEYVATPTFEPDDQAFERVQQHFVEGLRDAVAKGLSERGLKRMKTSLDKYSDNFRVQFGLDPPVKVKPLKVRLKEGAKPVKCKAPRYPPLHQIFLETHVQELLKAMLVRENHRSRWASPSRVVPKKLLEDLRMVIDSRRVNSETEPMPFPMPQLEVSITHVIGATVFFSCDWFKGYWQLPLDPESQQYFTFMTHRPPRAYPWVLRMQSLFASTL